MLPKLTLLVLLPLFAAAAFAGVFFYFYQGGYDKPDSVDIPFHEISEHSPTSGKVVDLPGTHDRKGLLVVDAQHFNDFSETEIISLTSKIADRGFEVEVLGDFTGALDPAQATLRQQQFAAKLRQAHSFAVIAPRVAFSKSEVALVESFVRKGGKLLLVTDPSRRQRINTLASRFGLDFQQDYLYNTIDYDLNFRNIFVRDFQPDRLTAGLDSVALYHGGLDPFTGAWVGVHRRQHEVIPAGIRWRPFPHGLGRQPQRSGHRRHQLHGSAPGLAAGQ